jgi:hypothetical protein
MHAPTPIGTADVLSPHGVPLDLLDRMLIIRYARACDGDGNVGREDGVSPNRVHLPNEREQNDALLAGRDGAYPRHPRAGVLVVGFVLERDVVGGWA